MRLISDEEVLKNAKESTFTFAEDRRRYMDFLEYCLNNAPAVEAKEVVHAKWEECAWVEFDGIHCGVYTYPNGGLACSNCHHAFKKELLCPDNFCPNCGADMRTSAEQ